MKSQSAAKRRNSSTGGGLSRASLGTSGRERGEAPVSGRDKSNDSIKVICRFRPARTTPSSSSSGPFVIDTAGCSVSYTTGPGERKQFSFDRLFGEDTMQQHVFEEVKEVVDAVAAGFNGTVLAYGQTSAGKSWTMEGLMEAARRPGDSGKPKELPALPSLSSSDALSAFDDADFSSGGELRGVTPRAVDRLFAHIEAAPETVAFQVKLSYLEVYCERVRDLLNPTSDNLRVRERERERGSNSSSNKESYVESLTEVYCADRESVFAGISAGKANRASAPTLMNADSSRSHSIVSLTLVQKDEKTGRARSGRLFLVDLAGSEKVGKTGATGMRLEEAKNINGSLTTLGMVINALCDGSSHVPYRDSKLTRLLMDSLGGNSKTAMIICCSPDAIHSPETLSTLRFGERAKKIENHATVNEQLSPAEMTTLIEQLKKELSMLKKGFISRACAFCGNTGDDDSVFSKTNKTDNNIFSPITTPLTSINTKINPVNSVSKNNNNSNNNPLTPLTVSPVPNNNNNVSPLVMRGMKLILDDECEEENEEVVSYNEGEELQTFNSQTFNSQINTGRSELTVPASEKQFQNNNYNNEKNLAREALEEVENSNNKNNNDGKKLFPSKHNKSFNDASDLLSHSQNINKNNKNNRNSRMNREISENDNTDNDDSGDLGDLGALDNRNYETDNNNDNINGSNNNKNNESDELSYLRVRVSQLEAEAEVERQRAADQSDACLSLDAESKALREAVSNLENRLLQMKLDQINNNNNYNNNSSRQSLAGLPNPPPTQPTHSLVLDASENNSISPPYLPVLEASSPLLRCFPPAAAEVVFDVV